VTLKSISCGQYLLLFFLLLPVPFIAVTRSAAFSTTCSGCHNPLPYLRPKTMEPANHGLKTLKLWMKINLSSFEVIFSGKSLNYIFVGYWALSVVFLSIEMIAYSFFHFVNVAYHVDWFAYVEPFLYAMYKYYLFLLYNAFNVLLNLVC
jgi:hypothetical protein